MIPILTETWGWAVLFLAGLEFFGDEGNNYQKVRIWHLEKVYLIYFYYTWSAGPKLVIRYNKSDKIYIKR